MTSGFQQHQEAIEHAFEMAIDTERALQYAQQRQQELIAALIGAVGDTPGPESARNAMNAARTIGDKIDETLAKCAVIGAELTRYRGGF